MTKEEIKEITKNWKEPFKSVVNYPRFSIDYHLNDGMDDHEWLKDRGYELYMGGDCAYYIKGIFSLLATSYGDWGSCYVDEDTLDKGFELFLQMYKDGVVKLWRIHIYLDDKQGKPQSYYYNDEYGVWETYDNKFSEWIECDNPLK